MSSLLNALLPVAGAAVVAILFVEISHRLVARLGRRSVLAADLARTAHWPFLATVTLFAVQQAVRATAGAFPGRDGVLHALVILVIAAFAWLVAALVLVWRTSR